MERFCLTQDCSGHWYCIPVATRSAFYYLDTKIACDDTTANWERDFAEQFSRHAIGRPVSITFTDPED